MCVALLPMFATVLVWYSWNALLSGAGRLLVVQDPLEPADIMVVSTAGSLSGAFEASWLYQDGVSSTVILASQHPEPEGDDIRALRIPYLEPTELMTQILERSGVPPTSIVVLPGLVEGTEDEIIAVTAFVKEHNIGSLLYVTAKTHTARARWLLAQQLPAHARFSVRSPRTDSFDPSSWYRTRDGAREIAFEYLRWFNTLILRDPWSRRAPRGLA